MFNIFSQGLKDDELDKISRYRGNVDRVFWGDAYDLAIKQDGISLRGFQDKILRRFSRGKGRLQKLFTVIVAHQRRTYLEKIRLKPKDLEIILGNRMPRKVPALTKGVHAGGINDDYVKGTFLKIRYEGSDLKYASSQSRDWLSYVKSQP